MEIRDSQDARQDFPAYIPYNLKFNSYVLNSLFITLSEPVYVPECMKKQRENLYYLFCLSNHVE